MHLSPFSVQASVSSGTRTRIPVCIRRWWPKLHRPREQYTSEQNSIRANDPFGLIFCTLGVLQVQCIKSLRMRFTPINRPARRTRLVCQDRGPEAGLSIFPQRLIPLLNIHDPPSLRRRAEDQAVCRESSLWYLGSSHRDAIWNLTQLIVSNQRPCIAANALKIRTSFQFGRAKQPH